MEKERTRLEQLERIVSVWQDYLFRFAYMRTGLREEASDLKFYLLRSVSNRCSDWRRRRKPVTVPLDEAAAVECSEEDRNIRAEYIRVRRLLDSLPERQAEVIRLKCNDELTFAEIAELTGTSEATVKSRYRYGIRHINELLKRKGNGRQ